MFKAVFMFVYDIFLGGQRFQVGLLFEAFRKNPRKHLEKSRKHPRKP